MKSWARSNSIPRLSGFLGDWRLEIVILEQISCAHSLCLQFKV
ncbi:hypothetical protein L917_19083 [Phytophthora nicotianae]|uniref:Uncharacterized protein n=1 Tax=Phytophthora nicotianae TaxID=4792 RepID=W2K5J0_PHYNI|nr:hypothetical protein L917_19083 [Phytophthora nicotianae]ETM33647.1 hypothetical protein L914_19141 [Phytophthora nicotianae]